MFAEIFNRIIEISGTLKIKEPVIWGTGQLGISIGYILNFLSVDNYCYTDNDQTKWNQEILGKKIYLPDHLLRKEKNSLVILVASMFGREIATQLLNYGFVENEHFLILGYDCSRTR